MRIVFLPGAVRDLRWFRRYYEEVFGAGARGAASRYDSALRALGDQPQIGRPSPVPGVREFPIARTPFLLIYRIRDERIEILRVFDGRAAR